MRGGTASVPARPQPMVAGGRVLGEDGRGRAVTGPRFPFKVITVTEMQSRVARELTLIRNERYIGAHFPVKESDP